MDLEIRQIQSLREFYQALELLRRTFENEIATRGINTAIIRRATNMLRRFLPLLWLFFSKVHHITDLFWVNFVCVRNGMVVVNLTVHRMKLYDKNQWLLSNAAKHSEYQPKGFEIVGKSRRILRLACEHAKKMGAECIFADVRSDNYFVLKLLKSFGFKPTGITVYFKKDDGIIIIPQASPFVARIAKIGELKQVWEFQRTIDSINSEISNPIQPQMALIITGILQKILCCIANRYNYHLIAEIDGRLVGVLQIYAGQQSCHRLKMIVHPDYHGQAETTLIEKATAVLKKHGTEGIILKLGNPSQKQIYAIKNSGFRIIRCYHRLGLKFSHGSKCDD